MTDDDLTHCEPFRVWNRLEPRPRKVDFERVLRAEIPDPLFMIGRQWQFGEIKGEDTGSAIFAKVALRSSKLTGFENLAGAIEPYNDSQPLETRVEREPIVLDPRTRAQSGRYLMKLVDEYARAFVDYRSGHYRAVFARQFPFEMPDHPGDDPNAVVERHRFQTNARAFLFQRVLAGRAIDGGAVYDALPRGNIDWPSLPAELAVQVVPAHASAVLQALGDFRDWFESLYETPASAADTAWNPARLEYNFECRVARPDGSELALRCNDYPGGKLDWYDFDVGTGIVAGAGRNEDAVALKVVTMIPTPAEFPGMPSSRWWEIEDRDVDLGHIEAESTDIAKILVAEFALVYGNNWFVIPLTQEVGTIGEIEGIVVTDVFGQRTFVGPVGSAVNTGADWTRWDFMSLSAGSQGPVGMLGPHLFLPPSLIALDESEPVESVSLLRDEMTNTVWGVETRIPDGLGGSREGADAARQLRNALRDWEEAQVAEDDSPAQSGTALGYTLGSTVPENYIPFVPVRENGSNREMCLQRASMPRFLLDTVRPVRPLTNILRPGLTHEQTQTAPYYIHEEEIPRVGISVAATWQRTRWYGGSTFAWLGRRKRVGRGGGGSGLRYDMVRDNRVGKTDGS